LTAVTAQPRITPVDRFGLTLCLAIIVHGVIILGVTFAGEDTLQPRFETMEIILVQQESEPDEEAELLAQANLKGGGYTGQIDALRMGIARALLKVDADYRKALRKEGLLTRDPRMVERKKVGLKKARRSEQYSKR